MISISAFSPIISLEEYNCHVIRALTWHMDRLMGEKLKPLATNKILEAAYYINKFANETCNFCLTTALNSSWTTTPWDALHWNRIESAPIFLVKKECNDMFDSFNCKGCHRTRVITILPFTYIQIQSHYCSFS